MKKKALLLISLLILLLFSTSVLAQQGNILEDIFGPLFGDLDIPAFYEDYATVVDFILGTILFIGIAQVTLGNLPQFKERRGGSAVVVIVGIMLSIGLSVWMANNNIHLGDLGPAAGVVLAVLVGYAIFLFFKGLGENRVIAGSLAYVITFYALSSFGLIKVLEEKYATLSAIAHLMLLVALIASLYKLINFMTGLFRGEGKPMFKKREEEGEKVKEEMGRLIPSVERRTEFTSTPLLELRKTSDPYGFVAEVMRKDYNPFDYYNFVPFVTHINDLMREEGKALRDVDPKDYNELREALQNMNQNKKVMEREYWNDLRDKCSRVAEPIFGRTPIVGWSGKRLKDELAKKETKEMMGAVKTFIDGLKAKGIFKVPGNEIDRVKFFFVSLAEAIEAYENLKRKYK